MKRIIILTIAICSGSGAIFAERTETWLQRENTEETSSDNLRIGTPTENTEETSSANLRIGIPTDDPIVGDPAVPVGEGILVLTALAGLYGLKRARNNKDGK
ncbi:hypothetical protein FACS1894162_4430 [Bacteroidia bacterium]|nr:hypothetical protein FACS1894162_4430 [Bacteroidia bacterium]